jgi:type IV secretion system protein VirB9
MATFFTHHGNRQPQHASGAGRCLAAIILTLLIAPMMASSMTAASAAEQPAPTSEDSRVRQIIYNPNQVFTIKVKRGVATRIVLAKDEKIREGVSGFSGHCDTSGSANPNAPASDWCIVARKDENSIYVKPKSGANEPNNLEISTNKRDYSFEFVLLPPNAPSHEKVFRVTFIYPEEQAKAYAAQQAALQAAQPAPVDPRPSIADKLKQDSAPLNWQYSMQIGANSHDIAPAMAFDDGQKTHLKFPNNRTVPAIFKVAEDGSESTVNWHGEGDFIVVHRVLRRMVLRQNNQVVGVWNDAYDADGVKPESGTSVDGVKRNLRGSR